MRQKKKPGFETGKSSETDTENDPVTKLKERLRLIQERVGKVIEKVSIPDPIQNRKKVEENLPKSSFDMEAWRREREKIRSSRFFEEVEMKPYERKHFDQIEIRSGIENFKVKKNQGPLFDFQPVLSNCCITSRFIVN